MRDISTKLTNAAFETLEQRTHRGVYSYEYSAVVKTVAAVLRELDRSGQYPPLGHGDPTLADLADDIEEE